MNELIRKTLENRRDELFQSLSKNKSFVELVEISRFLEKPDAAKPARRGPYKTKTEQAKTYNRAGSPMRKYPVGERGSVLHEAVVKTLEHTDWDGEGTPVLPIGVINKAMREELGSRFKSAKAMANFLITWASAHESECKLAFYSGDEPKSSGDYKPVTAIGLKYSRSNRGRKTA